MKKKLIFFLFSFFLLFLGIVEKSYAQSNSPLAIYYGGSTGTEYVVTGPLTYTKVMIDGNFSNPQVYKEYLFLGGGVMLSLTAKFPLSTNYSVLKVCAIGGFVETFPIENHKVEVQLYVPLKSGRSIFLMPE